MEPRTASDPSRLAKVEAILDHPFSSQALLDTAMTHASARGSGAHEDNTRLAYLGDAVLNLVVAHRDYNASPQLDRGALTEARARVVKNEALDDLADRTNLGRDLLRGNVELRDKKARATLVEALLGAVFEDSGFNYREAARVITRLLKQAEPR